MYRIHLVLVMSLLFLWGISSPQLNAQTDIAQGTANEVPVNVTNSTQQVSSNAIGITFSSKSPNNLFMVGEPIDITVHITNSGRTHSSDISLFVTTSLGSVVYSRTLTRELPNSATIDETISLGNNERLPCGSYIVEALVKEDLAYNSSRISIWNGPLEKPNSAIGISYAGPLDAKRVATDLDLFKLIGICWIRFPMQGWLPQGETLPPQSGIYDTFIRQASDRGYNLLAAFAPQVTVDPSVNSAQAEKDYHESLLAAATRYGFKIKNWELLTVKPPQFPTGLSGIGYRQLTKGRDALRQYNKSLTVSYALSDPVNVLELLFYRLPAKGDAIGFHYDISGVPEYARGTQKSSFDAISELSATAKKTLKRTSMVSGTDYGFDSDQGDALNPILKAAFISRVTLLNASINLGQTFWRHDSGDQDDSTFIGGDGAIQPGMLALRTTLHALDDVTSVKEMPTHIKRAHILSLGIGKKSKKKQRCRLALWTEDTQSRTAVIIQTSAVELPVTDLWGNTIVLQPTDGVAILQIDEYPRFIDLGNNSKVEISETGNNFSFSTKYAVLTPGSDITARFNIQNNQQFLKGSLAGEIRFRAWPIGSNVITRKILLAPNTNDIIPIPLKVPDGARNDKEAYEVNAEIFIGERRIGYLVLPVYYSARVENKG